MVGVGLRGRLRYAVGRMNNGVCMMRFLRASFVWRLVAVLAALGFFGGAGAWAAALDLTPEDVTNQGRIDLTLKLDNAIVVIEFKRVEGTTPTGEAIAQLKARGYADKYRADGRPIYLLGIEFSAELRNIVGWDVEPLADGRHA